MINWTVRSLIATKVRSETTTINVALKMNRLAFYISLYIFMRNISIHSSSTMRI